MVLISGDDWSGTIQLDEITKAKGCVNGYSWLYKATGKKWLIEIAEDQAIGTEDLPLVGFGCGGWLYESDNNIMQQNETDALTDINNNITKVFTLFKQNKLDYIPAVTCGCSD